MTEEEWEECADPELMLEFLYTRSSSERKLRLFSVACCRRIWHLLSDERSRRGVEVGERLADGLATEQEWQAAHLPANDVCREMWALEPRTADAPMGPRSICAWAAYSAMGGCSAFEAALASAQSLAYQMGPVADPCWATALHAERKFQCSLLRDVFGTPFRPRTIDPAWLSAKDGEAPKFATRIYNECRWKEMPRLAEALARAGCQDAVILDHCQQPGEHVRGCWVVDALLGKEAPVRTGLTTQQAWLSCPDLMPLLEFLDATNNDRKWRLLAVACCRRIWDLITDVRSRTAVEVAARFADGQASQEELAGACAAAREAFGEALDISWETDVEPYRVAEDQKHLAEARVYRAFAAQNVAGAALACVPVNANDPDDEHLGSWYYASQAVANMAKAGVFALSGEVRTDEGRPRSVQIAEQAEAEEASHQADLLRDIFGHLFGPMTEQFAWLPFADFPLVNGRIERQWPSRWCLLPAERTVLIDPAWLAWNDRLVRTMAQRIYAEERFDLLPILADALEEAGCTSEAILSHCRESAVHVRGCWVIDLLLEAARSPGVSPGATR